MNHTLLAAAIILFANSEAALAATDTTQTTFFSPTFPVRDRSDDAILNNENAIRLLRTTNVKAEGDSNDEEREITDPVILENLAKFEDWVSQGKTAEIIYKELGLKHSWKIAYQTSRWQQFLFDEPEYILFRKYVKYLKLIGRSED